MKTLTASGLLLLSFFFATGCEKSEIPSDLKSVETSQCMKGILVKKGICGERVIKITSQNKDGLAYATQWKDESSGKSHENVFTVENSCAFPATLNEGGAVSFKVTTDKTNDCAQCGAFTPVPKEKNSIIVNGDCLEKKVD